jgi:hypothetical protein
MNSAGPDPAHLGGGSFPLRDLRVALSWAESNPGVRLQIMLDHPYISEVIEIRPSLSSPPRWLIWTSLDGELRVADLAMAEFELPYLTVDSALRFIESTLLDAGKRP